jgi:hypothetical protein
MACVTISRALADSGGTFDPATVSEPTEEEKGWGEGSEQLSSITFPHSYELATGVGTTPQQRWRILAWLSTDPEIAPLASGDPFGTAVLTIEPCDQYGDYCGVTEGVNVTVEAVAP